MPETPINNLKIHKVPNIDVWEEHYDEVNGIGADDVVVINPAEVTDIKKYDLDNITSQTALEIYQLAEAILDKNNAEGHGKTALYLYRQDGNVDGDFPLIPFVEMRRENSNNNQEVIFKGSIDRDNFLEIVLSYTSSGTNYVGYTERKIISEEKTLGPSQIISFDDGVDNILVKAMTVDIQPLQDLHGYDYPWASGGGPNFATETGAYSNFDRYYIDSSTHKIVSAGSSYHRCILIPCTASKKYIIRSGAATTVRASAYDATPTTSATPTAYIDGKSLTSDPTQVEITTTASSKYLVVQLFADADTSSGAWSGYNDAQMYEIATTGLYFSWDSNICPITGWTGANVTRCGKNLFDKSTVVTGELNPTGGINTAATSIRTSAYIKVNPSTEYILYHICSTGSVSYCWAEYDGSKTFISTGTITGVTQKRLTTSATTSYIRVCVLPANLNSCIVVQQHDINPAYAPYTGTIYTVSWTDEAETIHKGMLVYNGDGTWTLTKTGEVLDAANMTWYVATGSDLPIWFASPGTQYIGNSASYPCYAERYLWSTGSVNDTPFNEFRVTGNGAVYVNTGNNSDPAYKPQGKFVLTLKTVYQETYTITTGELVKTLLGSNNVWADCGNISLTYLPEGLINTSKAQELIEKNTKFAPLNSPAFSGTPTAPTATSGTNTIQIATTAFVQGELGGYIGKPSSPTDGDFLKYQSSTSSWVPNSATYIPTPNSPSNGNILRYNGTNWVAGSETLQTKIISLTLAETQGTNEWTETPSGSGVWKLNISITGTNSTTKIDLQPDATVFNQLKNDNIEMLYIENNNGTFSAVAVGSTKPAASITVQASLVNTTTNS